MKKKSITDESTIESTKMMIAISGDPRPLIKSICQTHSLTSDFIREFSQYIDEKMFSTSHKLTESMISQFSYLFSDEIFKDHFFEGRDVYLELSDGKDDEVCVTETTVDWYTRADNFDISLISRFSDIINEKYNKDPAGLKEFLMKVIRTSDVSELTVENCCLIMGYDDEVDALLLKRVQSEEIREQILLTLSLSDSENNISSTAYKYMGNDMKERTLGTENISFREFIKVISQSKDIGWQNKMIQKVISDEIEIIPTAESFDSDMLILINAMNENVFVNLTKLSKYAPNAFSYKIMNWAMLNKYFNEEDYIQMLNVLKRSGCLFQLKKIAKENNYTKLLTLI